MSTIYPPAIAAKIEEFQQEALCRHESNQHKARKIWKELSPILNETDRREIGTEWSHYLIGELETSEFGDVLKKAAARYRTI